MKFGLIAYKITITVAITYNVVNTKYNSDLLVANEKKKSNNNTN